jgi:UDP-2,3-diacylglucosamine pyrophosphatase LpxH
MAAQNLSREVAAETLAALAQYGSQQAAADALGLACNTFKSRLKRSRQILNQPAEERPAPSPRLPVTADECWALLDGFIQRKRIPKVKPPKWEAKKEQRLCVAGDFHAPFHDPDVVASLIANEGPRTDTLIISGDLMDFYSISRFLKYERVTIEQEIAGTDALLGQLSAAFPDVLIVSGNHDSQRFEKQLRTLLAPEMMHVIELLTGGNLSVIHMLAKRYPNVRFAPQQAGTHTLGWMTQVGDLLVTHAEKFSRVPGSAVRQIDEGLTDFDHVYNLKPWRVLLQAHTHAASIIPWKADRLLGETGCMCVTHGYQMTARMGGRPQRQGYVTLTQHAGITDVNSVRFHWLNANRKAA